LLLALFREEGQRGASEIAGITRATAARYERRIREEGGDRVKVLTAIAKERLGGLFDENDFVKKTGLKN
jgi:hypothetical protein